jgi:unsaturated chondroitin disaccharide hydrolase
VTIEFDLTTVGNKPAGVIGYADSSQSITGYDSFGMVIELSTSGYFRVRNGSTYAAARTVNFSPNKTYHFRIIANTSNRTYDVYVTPPGGSATLIASGYSFRNQSMNDVGKVALVQASGYGNYYIANHKISK